MKKKTISRPNLCRLPAPYPAPSIPAPLYPRFHPRCPPPLPPLSPPYPRTPTPCPSPRSWSLFCYSVLCVLLVYYQFYGKERACCFTLFLVTVSVMWLFLTMPWVGLQCGIEVFPYHTHLCKVIFIILLYNVKCFSMALSLNHYI